MPLPGGVRVVLLDIEGTTTPIAFVTEVLFPFAREGLAAALARAGTDDLVADAAARLREEWREEKRSADPGDPPPELADGAAYAAWLMDRDRKSTGLKALQGLIWREGYASGALRGAVFEDVPRALECWRARGARVAIFSSGSVLAQRLLFAHSDRGDLTPHLGAFFDTTTGPKREPSSYAAIARALGCPPAAMLFLSDVPAELDAAAAAGLGTGLLRRPGNPPVAPGEHPVFESFEALL